MGNIRKILIYLLLFGIKILISISIRRVAWNYSHKV